jgi:hypothetical protein
MKKINNKLSVFIIGVMLLATGGCMHENIYETDPLLAMSEDLNLLELIDEGANLRMNPSDQNRILAVIKQATAKYHQLEAAEAAGYSLDPHCVEVPGLGGMGQHAAKLSLVDATVDPSHPEVLLYEPGQNGQYKLVGVEFIVAAAPWDYENEGPPMLGNVAFDDHREMIEIDGKLVNAKGGPPFPHYQLHVWVWKNNPRGMYFPLNPSVSCAHAGGH